MTRHAWVVGLVLLALVGQTGCHCTSCWPCGKNWCGSQCGEMYWNEWFSLPPDCCDPCTNCGAFRGPNNRFLRRGTFGVRSAMGHYDEGYQDDYGGGQYGPEPVEGRPAGSSEELPPANATSDGYDYNEIGQRVSYDEPVDSPYASRTLGRPRSRMLAR